MKKSITVMILSCFCFIGLGGFTHPVQAKGISVGVNTGIALPLGNFSDVAKAGFGAGVTGEYFFLDNLAGIFSGGYCMWPGKSIVVLGIKAKTDYSAIPLQAGARYYFGSPSGLRPYAGAEFGVHLFKAKGSVPTINPISGAITSTPVEDNTNEVSFAPCLGLAKSLGSVLLDVNAFFQYVAEDLSYLGLRLGVKFGG